MNLPFSTEQFLGVFGRYNEAVWPAQVVFVALAMRTGKGDRRLAIGCLQHEHPRVAQHRAVDLPLLRQIVHHQHIRRTRLAHRLRFR